MLQAIQQSPDSLRLPGASADLYRHDTPRQTVVTMLADHHWLGLQDAVCSRPLVGTTLASFNSHHLVIMFQDAVSAAEQSHGAQCRGDIEGQ